MRPPRDPGELTHAHRQCVWRSGLLGVLVAVAGWTIVSYLAVRATSCPQYRGADEFKLVRARMTSKQQEHAIALRRFLHSASVAERDQWRDAVVRRAIEVRALKDYEEFLLECRDIAFLTGGLSYSPPRWD